MIVDIVDLNVGDDRVVVGGIVDGGCLSVMISIKQHEEVLRLETMTKNSELRNDESTVIEDVTEIGFDLNVYRDLNITSAFSQIELLKELYFAILKELDSSSSYENDIQSVSTTTSRVSQNEIVSLKIEANNISIHGLHSLSP